MNLMSCGHCASQYPVPYLAMPMLLSSSRGFALQSTQLASPLMNLMSCGHCASQYPVPYLAPAWLLPRPCSPFSSISTKYIAPFMPQKRLETSMSNANSRFFSCHMKYWLSSSRTYSRESTFTPCWCSATNLSLTPPSTCDTPYVSSYFCRGDPLYCTILGATCPILVADALIPCVASVAIIVTACLVDPSPVCIEPHFLLA